MEKDKYWELRIKLPNSSNQEVVNDYLLSLKLANCSKGSIIIYRAFLEHFFSYQEEQFSIITSETIQQWYMKHQKHVKESTLSLRLSILSSFYTFCLQEEHIECSPMKSRWFPRLPQPLPRYLEKGEIAKTRHQSEKTSLRDQAMVEFMLTSGCRVSEVSQLDIEDIDFEKRIARVVGKGKKFEKFIFRISALFFLNDIWIHIQRKKEHFLSLQPEEG